MCWDYRKLLGRIAEKCGTQRDFAEKLGISEMMLSKKLNNQSQWKQLEMEKACEVLEIPKEEVSLYFFTVRV